MSSRFHIFSTCTSPFVLRPTTFIRREFYAFSNSGTLNACRGNDLNLKCKRVLLFPQSRHCCLWTTTDNLNACLIWIRWQLFIVYTFLFFMLFPFPSKFPAWTPKQNCQPTFKRKRVLLLSALRLHHFLTITIIVNLDGGE